MGCASQRDEDLAPRDFIGQVDGYVFTAPNPVQDFGNQRRDLNGSQCLTKSLTGSTCHAVQNSAALIKFTADECNILEHRWRSIGAFQMLGEILGDDSDGGKRGSQLVSRAGCQ